VKNSKKAIKAGKTALVITLSILFGFLLSNSINSKNDANVDLSLLAKRTLIDNPNDQKVNFTSLRNELENYVVELEADEEINSASVYFEYLPSGVSINVNEKNESIGASLMKVPFVMNLYKMAEEGKLDLDSQVKLKKEWLNSEYGTLYEKGEGYSISLREAAKLTLEDSDNTALLLISESLEGLLEDGEDAINYLDVDYELNSDESVLISTKSYSSILKCLYLACFNSPENSQEMLTYLSQSSFTNRLTSLLPKDLTVAHKIGTFSDKFQSDCGIVYVPERNYLLCVMVDGKDPAASRTIAVISSKVHSYISDLEDE
jgi:beta-lactamase class A